jgi:hypothetical protein
MCRGKRSAADLVSRRVGSREHIADGMVIAIAEVLFSLANDLFLDAGEKTSGTRMGRLA